MVPLHTSSLNSNHNHHPQLLAHSLAERKVRQKQQLFSMSSNPLKSQSKHESITSNNNRSFNSKRSSNSSSTNNTASDASFSVEDNTGENNISQESPAPIPDQTEGEEQDGEEEKAAAIQRPGPTAYIQVSPISPKSDSKNPSRNSYIDDTEDEGLHYSQQQEEV